MGKSVEISHEGQNPKGPFKEMHPNNIEVKELML